MENQIDWKKECKKIADFAEHRRRISESAEWEIGTELQNKFISKIPVSAFFPQASDNFMTDSSKENPFSA